MLGDQVERAVDGALERTGHQLEAARAVVGAVELVQEEREQVLGVGRAMDRAEGLVAQAAQQRPADPVEAPQVAVVHERVAAVLEGVAVGLAHLQHLGGGAHVGQHAAAPRDARELAQVAVAPGRGDRAEDGRLPYAVDVPGEAEPVPVQRLFPLLGVEALVDQRVARGRDQLGKRQRLTAIEGEAAHAGEPS